MVTPCSGMSIANTTNPAPANESAMASASSRLRVRPCTTMATGQPAGGGPAAPAGVLAFGTETSTGICSISVATGSGLKRVSAVLLASSGEGFPCQLAVSGAERLR